MKILYCAPNLQLWDEWCYLIGKELKKDNNVLMFDYRKTSDSSYVLKEIAKRFKPDLLFVIKGEIFNPEAIKSINCKKFLWNNDDFQTFNNDLVKAFDFVATPAEDFIPKYEELGVKAFWLNYPYDPNTHKFANLRKEFEIVFVGTYYKEREKLLKESRLLDQIMLYGNGWSPFRIGGGVGGGHIINRITAEKMVKLYNETKIILNIHQESMKKHKVKANLRIYESLGCGCFVLTDYCNGMEELFEDGKDLVIYDDAKDLRDNVDYYLYGHESKREAIASNGHQTVKEFTIEKTLKRIFNKLEES